MRIRIGRIIGYGYVAVSLVIFAFVNFNGSTGFYNYTVPFINGHPIVIHAMFSVGITLLLLFSCALNHKPLRFDSISFCLLLKCLLDYSKLIYISEIHSDTYIWYSACSLVAFLAYLILSNQTIDQEDFKIYKRMILLFGITLSFQTIYTFLFCGVDYFNLYYKLAMVIPYGGTNIIASMLVPIAAMVYLDDYKTRTKIVLMIVFVVAIIFTKSRGGMIILLLSIIMLSYSIAKKKDNRTVRYLLITLFFVIFIFAVFSNDTVQTVLEGYSSISNKSGADRFLSGRLSGFTNAFENLNNHSIFLGRGMHPYTVGIASGSHNIVLDLIVKCGLIGTALYGIAIFKVIKYGKALNRSIKMPLLQMIIIICINSLYEVCYFSYECDAMLWIFIGIMMGANYTYLNMNTSTV